MNTDVLATSVTDGIAAISWVTRTNLFRCGMAMSSPRCWMGSRATLKFGCRRDWRRTWLLCGIFHSCR